MPRGSSSSSGLARNVKEKNRRMHMKCLLDILASGLPNQSVKLPVNELLDQATNYTKMLKGRVEELKGRREVLKANNSTLNCSSKSLSALKVRNLDSIMEVNLITGLETSFSLHEVISILQQEGADIVTLSYHTACGRVFYTIYSQAFSSRIGIETTRVQERLMSMLDPAI